MKKIIWLLIVLISVIIGVFVFSNMGATAGYTPEIQQNTANEILNATVQIYMFALIGDGELGGAEDSRLTLGAAQQYLENDPNYYMGQGLGTLVMTNDGMRMVTHDHWGALLEDADVVQIRDAWNRPLQTITGLEFRMSILYRDTGTMVLVAPAGINLVPVALGDSRQVSPGGITFVTRQNPDGSGSIEVIQATVEMAETFKGLEAWRLKTLNGDTIITGDSGGGVWTEGGLVGNLWAVDMAIDWQVWNWESAQPKETETPTFFAAQFSAQVRGALAEATQSAALEAPTLQQDDSGQGFGVE